MKKWTGGLLIVGLAFILVLSYSFIGNPESSKKQSSAYEFFNPLPPEKGNSDGDDELSLAKKERLRVVQKKPQLIHLQGLSDLYSLSENVTDEESDALLVWRQMRFLFPRSDALPETAKGIKEALAIWKDLLPMIEKDKALRLGDITANEIEGCPYFVKASNNELEIPCGLLEDSSITLIGIPNSEKDSFQIELIGQRELNPPIVLRYKVFLPGENLTKEPFTIQNTWTKESGWGTEERCPDHRMPGVLRVDGLIKCNIQIGQRTAEESLNASHPTYRKFGNVSGGSVSASTALHFVEGNPFTASLWVGVEGFHMTVNGRHETSFAHRDNLEPWLVNRVNVKGGLTIMSLLAKGLPVTEDVDLADAQNLRAPSLSNKRLALLIGVFSAGNNFERRMAIRRTWMKYDSIQSGDGAVRFFIGLVIDGLIKCNIQIGQRTAEESLNASHPTYRKFGNVSGGSVSASTALHFVEGNPFTASLWVGVEGFHMTVNGRHETSFAHRDNLEPWLVNRVNVKGGLTIMSLLAKGLPVTEDVDLADAQNLRAPSLSNKRLALLIGVFSAGNNFERRMAIRRTWMKYDSIQSGDGAVRFFIGLHVNKEVNFKLWKEAQAFKDIQLMPFVDYYSLLTYKTIAICILGTKILSAKFIMKTDDDAFVRINEVLSSLKGKPSNGLLYGSISFDSEPHRDKDNKWYISDKEWPHSLYPPWAHGPGYIISQDIAKFIVHGHMKRELTLFKLEDVGVGIWIEQFEKHGHKIEYVNDDRFHNAGCESDYILAHYQNPRMMLCLWEKLHKDQKPECCED